MSAHTSQAYPGRHHALQSGRRPRKRTRRTQPTDCMPLANLRDRMWRHAHCRSIHYPTYRHTAHRSGQRPGQGSVALSHLPMSRRRSHTTHTTQPSTDESQTQSYDSYDSTIYRWVVDAVIWLIRLNHRPMSCTTTHTTIEEREAYKEDLPPS